MLVERIRALGPVLDMEATRALYETSGAEVVPAGMRVLRDLAYGPDNLQRLDVYGPASAGTRPAPVLIVVHGGGFIRGDKSERSNAGIHFAKAGYLTLVANYRLAPAHPWPSGAEDVGAVWRWAQQQAAAYGGDLEQMFLLGESAGAAHVASATLIRSLQPQGGLRPAGIVLVSGPYDAELELRARRQLGIATPDPRNEAYFGADTNLHRQRSIIRLIDAEPLPVLITFAELDLIQMQVQAGELFAHLVTHCGYSPAIAVIRGHNHLSQCFSLNTGDDALADPILRWMAQVPRQQQAGSPGFSSIVHT
jgi:acetyl esterase